MKAVIAESTATLTLAAGILGYSVLAQADRLTGAVGSTPSITVSLAGLDISNPHVLEMLYTRIERAARSVCGFDYSRRELSRGRHAKACYKSSLEAAVKQVNRPTLTALHRAKTKSALG